MEGNRQEPAGKKKVLLVSPNDSVVVPEQLGLSHDPSDAPSPHFIHEPKPQADTIFRVGLCLRY